MPKTAKKPGKPGAGTKGSAGGKPSTNEAGLTIKQEIFVAALITTGNATHAARQAGYAHPEVAGHKLRKVGVVAAEIARLRAETLNAAVLTKAEAEALLSEQARAMGAPAKEVREAIKTLANLLGWNAPARTQLSGPNDGPIELSSMPLTELTQLLKDSNDDG